MKSMQRSVVNIEGEHVGRVKPFYRKYRDNLLYLNPANWQKPSWQFWEQPGMGFSESTKQYYRDWLAKM